MEYGPDGKPAPLTQIIDTAFGELTRLYDQYWKALTYPKVITHEELRRAQEAIIDCQAVFKDFLSRYDPIYQQGRESMEREIKGQLSDLKHLMEKNFAD